MSDAVTELLIQIKGDATSAVAQFKNIAIGVTDINTAFEKASTGGSNALGEIGDQAKKATPHVHGLAFGVRSVFDAVRFGALGIDMAGFYAVDEGMRALLASGMGLLPITGIMGTLAAAIGGSFIFWEEFGNHLDRDAAKAEALAKSLDKIPEAVGRLYQAQQLGAITEDVRKQYEKYLSGSQPLFVGPDSTKKSLNLIPAPDYNKVNGGFNPFAQGPQFPGVNAQPGPQMAAATPQQVQDFVNQQIDKAMAKNWQTVAGNEVKDEDSDQQNKLGDASKKQNEQLDKALRAFKEWQEFLNKIGNTEESLSVKMAAADQRHLEALKKQAEQAAENARAQIETQLKIIELDPLKTNQEKIAESLPLQQQLYDLDTQRMAVLQKLAADASTSDEARLEAQKQLNELTLKQAEDAARIQAEQSQGSFATQFGEVAIAQMNKWTTWAQESAKAFQETWNGATNAISGGLTHLFEYGAQKGQWFRDMWNGVVGSLISSFTQMTISWIMNHVIMEAAAVAFYEVMSLLGLRDVAAKILGDQMKTVSHILGETTATTVTTTQTATRITAHAAAAGAGAAESQASIPYIGPILAIAAIAAIVAAVMALAHGFEEGGYTGAGSPSSIAGVVHAGEYVIPASRVNSSTMPLLQAIHSGFLADIAAPHGPGSAFHAPRSAPAGPASAASDKTEIHMYFDKQKMVDAISQSDANQHFVVDVMAKNIHKFRT